MSDRIVKKISINDDLELVLYRAAKATDGCYLALRHPYKTKGQPGEVLLQPSQAPDIIKAIASAALELNASGFYAQGLLDAKTQ